MEKIATQAAIDILRRGGNAIDASVASAAVLGVTEPFSSGIGGGGFMVVRTASGRVTTIDGRETAPNAMHPMSFWENGRALPFNDARFNGLSVGVPGTVETWAEALEKFGTMSLAEVLAPAIHTARHGYVIDQVECAHRGSTHAPAAHDTCETALVRTTPSHTRRRSAGLSRRRSRVRVPSLRSYEVPAKRHAALPA